MSTRQIKVLAARRGSPIGTLTADDASEGPVSSSKHTVNRLIRGNTREVLVELTTVVFPAFDFDRPDEAIYEDEEILLVETLLEITGTAANGGAEIYGDHVNPVPDLDDPFFEDGPSGETLLRAIKDVEPSAIAEMVNRDAAPVLMRAKPSLEFERPIMLAIDITYVAYSGEWDELVRIQGAPKEKEYDWCYKFATASIVGVNVLFTAAMLPVVNAATHDPATYPGEDKTYRADGVSDSEKFLRISMIHGKLVSFYRKLAETEVCHRKDTAQSQSWTRC